MSAGPVSLSGAWPAELFTGLLFATTGGPVEDNVAVTTALSSKSC
jgi:hypothetical protein